MPRRVAAGLCRGDRLGAPQTAATRWDNSRRAPKTHKFVARWFATCSPRRQADPPITPQIHNIPSFSLARRHVPAARTATGTSAYGSITVAPKRTSRTAPRKIRLIQPAQESLEQRFTIGEVLGEGNFSTVRLVTSKTTGEQFALKMIDKARYQGREAALATELSILKQVRHPQIVALLEEFDTPTRLCLLFPYVAGGELFDRILDEGTFTEKDAARIIRQVAEALHFLHGRGIVHRDLKPENILFASKSMASDVLVTDFGLAKVLDPASYLMTACGTPQYVGSFQAHIPLHHFAICSARGAAAGRLRPPG